jgi:hypothetical protein
VLVTLWAMALQEEVVEALRKVVRMTVSMISRASPVLVFALLVVGVTARSLLPQGSRR